MLPNGDVIKTRQRSRKSSAGWDTTKMFVQFASHRLEDWDLQLIGWDGCIGSSVPRGH